MLPHEVQATVGWLSGTWWPARWWKSVDSATFPFLHHQLSPSIVHHCILKLSPHQFCPVTSSFCTQLHTRDFVCQLTFYSRQNQYSLIIHLTFQISSYPSLFLSSSGVNETSSAAGCSWRICWWFLCRGLHGTLCCWRTWGKRVAWRPRRTPYRASWISLTEQYVSWWHYCDRWKCRCTDITILANTDKQIINFLLL